MLPVGVAPTTPLDDGEVRVRSFEQQSGAQRIVLGAGTLAQVAAEVDRLGARRALVLTTPRRSAPATRVVDLLGGAGAGVFTGAVMHTPVAVTEEALGEVARLGADAVVSVGGGSTTGLGKAVSARTGLPHLVVPTTYAGSEVTPVLGETADGEKTTRSGPEILPATVLYDVELTLTLPWATTVTSAVNAMAHAVEALYAADRTPATDEAATDAITVLARGLSDLQAAPGSTDARADLLYGAWRAGTCLAAVGMGLHHKLCHTLGGSFDLPHAPTHTVVLPYAMAANAPYAVAAMAAVAAALGVEHAPAGLQRLVAAWGGPTSLGGLGLTEDDVPRAVVLATARPYPNPREVTPEVVGDLLTRAVRGTPIGDDR